MAHLVSAAPDSIAGDAAKGSGEKSKLASDNLVQTRLEYCSSGAGSCYDKHSGGARYSDRVCS